ncbi:hypothetical protein BDW62DRAFT_188598 [Aspergillus aurantiobrunneus]
MDRVPGINYLEFYLKNGDVDDNAPRFSAWRRNPVVDIARCVCSIGKICPSNCTTTRFFAVSWKAPQPVSDEYRSRLHAQVLRGVTAARPAIPRVLSAIFNLPMVLTHHHFSGQDMIVHPGSCHLAALDLSTSEIVRFGLNLSEHERNMATVHVQHGWARMNDYVRLAELSARLSRRRLVDWMKR